jgi:hypothetical protein
MGRALARPIALQAAGFASLYPPYAGTGFSEKSSWKQTDGERIFEWLFILDGNM